MSTYICTKCGSQVFKDPVRKDDDKKGTTTSGLGHWNCKCGNKAVRKVE